MKKTFKKLFAIIATPFVALVVHIGTSREINEHGDWDKHYEKATREAHYRALRSIKVTKIFRFKEERHVSKQII